VFSRTSPLRRELARALPERPFAVELWDGTSVSSTNGAGGPTFRVLTPRAVAHLLRAPGELGLGRAYVAGMLDVDDLDAAVRLIDAFEAPEIPLATRARLALAAVQACGVVVPPPVPKIELRARGPLHSLARDRRAVRYHYDAGNGFFALFLDDSMTYSCGVWNRGAATLAEAQETKLDLVCTKLGLEEGERVLDVGCGWGSFVIHAAKRYGVRALGVTLSGEQADLARRRVAEAGVADRVEIRVADYRELREEPFDAIASIGMVEHVGENRIDEYAARLAAQLRPGGRLLNHGIAQRMHGVDNEAGPFSERYVFPDGEPLHLSRIQLALERAGLFTDQVEGFEDDYAKTVTEWIANFERHLPEAERIAGVERTRVWRVYLHAARVGFETGFEAVYQVRGRKPE
jgi:cyclopropane-fatty-acyl-phospholipid synthase